VRKSQSETNPGQKALGHVENKTKRTGDMVQVVEYHSARVRLELKP
jgi:hypothetical protein